MPLAKLNTPETRANTGANHTAVLRASASTAIPARFIVRATPIAKPRMTRQDKWKQRPAVMRYRSFADEVRLAVGRTTKLDIAPLRLDWIAYLPMPASWSKRKREQMRGQPHRAKPDRDNIDKGIMDALFTDDSAVAQGRMAKYWDDGNGPRIEVSLLWEAEA